MEWDVEGTDEFKEWFLGLTDAEDKAVSEAINALISTGSSLGRPFAHPESEGIATEAE